MNLAGRSGSSVKRLEFAPFFSSCRVIAEGNVPSISRSFHQRSGAKQML